MALVAVGCGSNSGGTGGGTGGATGGGTGGGATGGGTGGGATGGGTGGATGGGTGGATGGGTGGGATGGGTGGGATGGGTGGGATGGGTGGGTGGATGGGTGGGTGGATGGGTGGSGGGAGGLSPRLVVTQLGGAFVWNKANTITTNAGALANIGAGTPAAVVATSSALYLVTASTTSAQSVGRWANPLTLSDGASPTASIPGTVIPISGTVAVQLDPAGNLWIEDSPGRVRLLANAGAATATTPATALFRHPFDQVFGFAYDPTGHRLFGGQVSGAGILAWNTADTRAGDAGVADFTLSADNAQTMHIAGDRLYTSFFTSNIKVWNGIGATTAPRAFDFQLVVDAGTTTPNPSIRDQRVFNNTLVVSVQGTGMASFVYLYKNASTLTATSLPDFIISHASVVGVKKAVLGSDGTLYVLDANGVSIFGNALTAPTFKVELTSGITTPTDLALVE